MTLTLDVQCLMGKYIEFSQDARLYCFCDYFTRSFYHVDKINSEFADLTCSNCNTTKKGIRNRYISNYCIKIYNVVAKV